MSVKLKPLREQVVLITGASSGIGRQSAVRFGQAGAKVILVSRNAEALQGVVSEIERAGGEAIAAAADVADFDQLSAAARQGGGLRCAGLPNGPASWRRSRRFRSGP